MGFWTEWTLQVYRAVMFPWHWLAGLEAYAVDMDAYDLCSKCGGYAGGSDGDCLLCSLDGYAVDIRYIAPQDDWGGYIYGYECNCPGQDCEECLSHTTPTNS